MILLGPMLNKKKQNIGGATVSFTQLVDYARNTSFQLDIVNTQRFSGLFSPLLNFLYTFYRFRLLIRKADLIFINLSQRGMIKVAPALVTIAKSKSIKVALRPFGGAMDLYFENYNSAEKNRFLKMLTAVDVLYLQTQFLINKFAVYHSNIVQLPTSRPFQKRPEIKIFQKKFLYLGQVMKSKGIDELLKVIDSVDSSYKIDIYGPIVEEEYHFIADKKYYKGTVSSSEVASVMSCYDVLLLPTYYEGEGYPGVIIEAFRSGLPVISSNWRSIGELIENGVHGKLINPKSDVELRKSILSLDDQTVTVMGKNARMKYERNFQSEKVLEDVFKELESIL